LTVGLVAIAMHQKGCGGDLTDKVRQLQTKPRWLVLSIGDYDAFAETQSMIWEDLCDSEEEAISVAGKIGSAFVVSATEVTHPIVRSIKT
jgi:hypothetical protein